jgi:predicted dehydrogenase
MTGTFTDLNTAELVHTAGDLKVEEIASDADPFVAQLLDVADAIEHGRAPAVPLADGLATLRIVLAARRSADERREVRL